MFVTLWRAPSLTRDLWRAPLDRAPGVPLDVATKAEVVWGHFALWSRELAVVPLFVVVLGTGVRGPGMVAGMWRAASAPGDHPQDRSERSRAARRAVITQFTRLAVDVPCAVAGALVMCTGYRAGALIREARVRRQVIEARARRAAIHAAAAAGAGAGNRDNDRDDVDGPLLSPWHAASLSQAWEVAVDAPYLLCGVVGTLALWRAPFLWGELVWGSTCGFPRNGHVVADTAALRRALALKHGLRAGLDVCAAAAGLVVTLGGWRASRLWQELRSAWHMARGVGGRDNRHVDRSIVLPWHLVCFMQLIRQLHPLELLCIPSVPLSLWRAPQLYRALSGTAARPLPAGGKLATLCVCVRVCEGV